MKLTKLVCDSDSELMHVYHSRWFVLQSYKYSVLFTCLWFDVILDFASVIKFCLTFPYNGTCLALLCMRPHCPCRPLTALYSFVDALCVEVSTIESGEWKALSDSIPVSLSDSYVIKGTGFKLRVFGHCCIDCLMFMHLLVLWDPIQRKQNQAFKQFFPWYILLHANCLTGCW